MKLLIKFSIIFYFVSIITGCGVLINKLFPGSPTYDKNFQEPVITESQEPIIPEVIDHEPKVFAKETDTFAQKTDTHDTSQFIDHYSPSDSESKDNIVPEYENITMHEENDANNSEMVKEQKASFEEDISLKIDEPNNEEDDSSLDSLIFDCYPYDPDYPDCKGAPAPDPEPDPEPLAPTKTCKGEKVTKHWHDLQKVVVVTNFLNIRSNYGTHHPIIGGAKHCEKLIVIDKHVERVKGSKSIKSRGWLKIKTQKGTTGWVAGWLTEYIDK